MIKKSVDWEKAPLKYLNETYDIPMNEMKLISYMDFHFPKSARGGRDYIVKYNDIEIPIYWNEGDTWRETYGIGLKNKENIENLNTIIAKYFDDYNLSLDPILDYDYFNSEFIPYNADSSNLGYDIYVFSGDATTLTGLKNELDQINISYCLFNFDKDVYDDFIYTLNDRPHQNLYFLYSGRSKMLNCENLFDFFDNQSYNYCVVSINIIEDYEDLTNRVFGDNTVLVYENIYNDLKCYSIELSTRKSLQDFSSIRSE